MSTVLTEVELRAINEDIQASARDEDSDVLAVLLPLGFSDEPSAWVIEAEEIFDRLVGGAIRDTVDQLQRVGNRIRVQRASARMVSRLSDLTCKAIECESVLVELDAAVLSNSPHLDTQYHHIVRNRLPEARGGVASFWQAVLSLRTLMDEKLPVFSFLEQPASAMGQDALRDALQTLDDGPPETVLLYGVAVVETLASMWDERQAIVAEANALVSGLTSDPEDLHSVKHDLHAVARRLEYLEPQHESYVNALTIFVHCIDDELPGVHTLEQVITVRDLFSAPAEQRLLDAAFTMMFEYGDTLEAVLFLLRTVLELSTEPTTTDE